MKHDETARKESTPFLLYQIAYQTLQTMLSKRRNFKMFFVEDQQFHGILCLFWSQ